MVISTHAIGELDGKLNVPPKLFNDFRKYESDDVLSRKSFKIHLFRFKFDRRCFYCPLTLRRRKKLKNFPFFVEYGFINSVGP